MDTSNTSFVVVAAKRNPRESLTTALSKLPFPLPLSRNIKNIIIKPSIFDPTQVGNTSLELVRAVVSFFERVSPVSIVESDNPVRTAEDAFKACSYDSMLSENVTLCNLSKSSGVKTTINGTILKEETLPEILLKNKFLVNIATLKKQENLLLSGAIKNLFGLLPMVEKSKFHKQLNEVLVDLLRVFPPMLNIIDLTDLVIGDRKDGITRHIGGVIVSTDPVALDSYSASLLGYDPLDIKYIRLAYELGLGEALPERIKVYGTEHQISKITELCQL